MKKALSLVLVLCLMAGLLAVPAAAADGSVSDAVATVRALGIMTRDENGNLKLEKNVTRAEFSKMLVAASSYRDTVGGSSGYSLFKDVKSDHWAVEYIKVCVENGWFVGYLDGTFRPNNPITLEEAATVVLRILGYTSEDLAGSYPTAQLSKFEALGLHDGFTTGRGQYMTRQDCAWLFYNTMAAQTKSGQTYAQTLGYTLDATGHVDYSALVTSGTSGPFTATGAVSVPFTPTAVYRNGAASTLSAAEAYDIYYYNENLRTVWIYANRVTGTYTAASPSAAAPTAVTVAGVSYSIETSGAAYKLSTQGQYAIGDTVTLLLGMNGAVADVVDAAAATGRYCGVVTGSSTTAVTGADGTTTLRDVLEVYCTDGVTRSFESETRMSAGTAVVVDYGASRTVSRASSRSLTGSINAGGTRLGDYTLAENVEILDTDGSGSAVRIYPARLTGTTLRSGHVLYYSLNAAGEIDRLILENVTGDAAVYGLVTSETEITQVMNVSSSYTVMLNGTSTVLTQPNKVFSVDVGGAVLTYEDGQVTAMRNLEKVSLDSAAGLTASAGNRTYNISEQVQVYIRDGSDYVLSSVSAVSDTGIYELTGWYDNTGCPAGGQIRILVAEAR